VCSKCACNCRPWRTGGFDLGAVVVAADKDFIRQLKASLAAHANADKAAPMQAYMKSAMPYWGIAAPLNSQLVKDLVRAKPLADATTLADTMHSLWQQALYREERYAAIELAQLRPHAQLVSLALLPVYEDMIVSGAWWDYGDDIASHGLGVLLQRWPAETKPVMRQWARGDQLWLRRAAMLSQLNVKAEFDAVLLYETILPSVGASAFAKEFFIRKGMGWALRQRSYKRQKKCRRFVTHTPASCRG
jgi:3-methyladenine DNA glycosylase AlkD